MTENKCLICNSPSSPPPNRSTSTSNILARQLSAIFLLRNIFELPSCIIQKYLISSGAGHNPSQWLSVCTQCDHLVRKTRSSYEQFLEADRKFRRAKYELVRKIKESVSPPSTLSSSLPPGFTNCVRISEECRQFVQLHDYDEPPKNPFREGDNRARELMGVAVDFDEANLNVKTEVLENVADLYHHTDMDLSCSQDSLSWTPEGHDYDDIDVGGGGSGYHNNECDNDDDEDDDDYAYLPPGPKCRKREVKAKSERSTTTTKNDPDPQPGEITTAEASNLIQFLTTSRGKRMVRYDGHNFYNGTKITRGRISSALTHFYCKWRHQGCPVRISFRNYNDEDATYTGFVPSSEPHDHSAAGNGRGDSTTKQAISYEVNSLAKEIVKDNVNASASKVIQMVQDSFVSDPEMTQELSKENVQSNLRKLIGNMKRRLGYKSSPRRRFIGTKLITGDTEGIKGQAPIGSHPEVKNDSIASHTEMRELTPAEASSLIQFLMTTRGKRMVRYDGHNFYKVSSARGCSISGVTNFDCKWGHGRHGCPARIGLRNYSEEDGSFTTFIPNAEAHNHSESADGGGADTKKFYNHPMWYEVNSMTKEIVKDNVNASASQVIRMVQDSFMGDPEVTEELSKENVQSNLRKVISSMKRRLGWKPDPNGKLKRERVSRKRRQGQSDSTLIGHINESSP